MTIAQHSHDAAITASPRPSDRRFGWVVTLVCAGVYGFLIAAPMISYDFGRHVVLGELGILENLQAVVLLVGMLVALYGLLRRETAALPGARPFLLMVALGMLYILGEEISWGQHYFRWATTGWFELHNDQGETNLHNTSSWFDQKPRALLLLAMVVGGVIHPLVKLARKGRGIINRPWWLAPTLAATPVALFAMLGGMPERLAEWGLIPKVNAYRSSEVEELFLYGFMLVYLLQLVRRIRRTPAA
ncbi:MAG: hypothetical protein ACK4RV_07900 [Caulobacter sp.]